MRFKTLAIGMAVAAGLTIAAAPASAQDVPSPYESAVTDHGQLQLESTLAKRRLTQARKRGAVRLSPRAQAVCLNKRQVAARLGPVKGRQVYALCARAGY